MCAQGLSEAAGAPVRVSFTPTLMPMSRGMQATCYVRLAGGASADDLRAHLQACAGPHRPLKNLLEDADVQRAGSQAMRVQESFKQTWPAAVLISHGS